jgi:hypothetical protein
MPQRRRAAAHGPPRARLPLGPCSMPAQGGVSRFMTLSEGRDSSVKPAYAGWGLRRLQPSGVSKARRSRILRSSATRAPQPELPPGNRHCHLIEMPPRRWPRASTAKLSGRTMAQPSKPPSRKRQPAHAQRAVDVAMAEREAHIEPNGAPNDRGRELMAGERNRHSPSQQSNQDALPFL